MLSTRNRGLNPRNVQRGSWARVRLRVRGFGLSISGLHSPLMQNNEHRVDARQDDTRLTSDADDERC